MHIRLWLLIPIFFWTGLSFGQDTYARLGQRAVLDGNFKLAAANLEEAVKTDSTDVYVLTLLGYAYYHATEYKKAIATYTKIAVLKPKEVVAYYYRGKARCAIYNETKGLPPPEADQLLTLAVKDFTTAIDLTPDDAKLYQNRAFAQRDFGLLKIQNDDKYYDKRKALSLLRASQSDFEKVLELNPNRKDIETHLEGVKHYITNLTK